jgi:hypothetical protein
VVVEIWDQRRLVVPLQYFIEKPFQNWTRTSSQILGTAFLWVDYAMPVDPLRAELERVCRAAPQWDGRVCLIQVSDTSERAMQLRCLASAADAGRAWDLRCLVLARGSKPSSSNGRVSSPGRARALRNGSNVAFQAAACRRAVRVTTPSMSKTAALRIRDVTVTRRSRDHRQSSRPAFDTHQATSAPRC